MVCSVLLLTAARGAAQDPLTVAPQSYKLIAENDRVRVLHAALGPGVKVAAHAHPDHVGVTLTGGTIQMIGPDGKATDVHVKADEALFVPAGTHSMVNPGKTPVEVIVVEMKGAPGTATIPASRPGMKMTSLLQNPRAVAYRVTVDPSFQEAAGTTHPYDQVVVPLGPADVHLVVDGKTITNWKRGEARLIGRGVAHESKGSKAPADIVIVSIK
jgi:mannose-6-phosphate isomerase-like protein (cupin superfamily)